MTKPYQLLVAKTDRENNNGWLPLWMHARDCAGMMARLTDAWVSDATIAAAGFERDRENFRKIAILLGMLHDIGKATSWFQCMITRALPEMRDLLNRAGFTVHLFPKDYLHHGKTPHALAGQWILLSEKMPSSIAAIVGAHHGKPADNLFVGQLSNAKSQLALYDSNFYGTEKPNDYWINAWRDMIKDALSTAGFDTVDAIPILSTQAQVLLSGLLIVADWIASNTYYFPLISCDDVGDVADYPSRVETGTDRLSFPGEWESPTQIMDEAIFKMDFGFLPNAVQRALYDKVNQSKHSGIYILEAQMGVGKTEAALAAAETLCNNYGEDGIFFGLPTQATSNGIFPRILDWTENITDDKQSIRLAHGAAALNKDYTGLATTGDAMLDEEDDDNNIGIHSWFNGNKKALLADFVVGTVDQFLMSVLKRKHFMLRHLGLSGKVVIIDECHAYDAYMGEYLERAIYWMAFYGVPVILLSATLPAARREAFVKTYAKGYAKKEQLPTKDIKAINKTVFQYQDAYPLLTWTDGDAIHQEPIVQKITSKTVQIRKIKIATFCDVLLNQLADGGCAVVIVNTVKTAQKLYDSCSENDAFKDFHLLLYHAQFTGVDRIRKEKRIMQRIGKASDAATRDKTIVIGTQVLEQSLDYDADVMVSQWCPMDLLMQRMGRLHRHERKRPDKVKAAQLFILEDDDAPWDKPSSTIYGDYLLMRTQKIMPESLLLPEDISPMVQKVYDVSDDLGLSGEDYETAKKQAQKREKDLKDEAKSYRMDFPRKQGLIGMLKGDDHAKDTQAEARVRSGGSSVDVLVMIGLGDDRIGFLPGHGGGITLCASEVPAEEEARLVAGECLHLPYIFNTPWQIDKTIADLEKQNQKQLLQWQQSPWIKGELVLLLDKNSNGSIAGYDVHYSEERGFEYNRREDEDE